MSADNLTDKLAEVITAIQRVSPEVWRQSVRAEVTGGAFDALITVAAVSFAVFAGRRIVALGKAQKDEDAIQAVVLAIVGGIIAIVAIVYVCHAGDIANAIINPEASAAKGWLKSLRGDK